MPKVYFRTADSKAISRQIDSEVDYNKALESISKELKLPRQNIRLVYDGLIRTTNFSLNSDIPHHIVHVVDKSKLEDEAISVLLTVAVGEEERKIGTIKTASKTPVNEFLNQLFESRGIEKEKAKSAKVLHRGVELAENETFLDNGVTNNDGLKILLGIEYPDPSDILLISTLLYQKVDPTVMFVRSRPQNFAYISSITRLRDANFFHSFQNMYEGVRTKVIHSIHNYMSDLDIGSEPLPDFPDFPEIPIQQES